MAKCDIADFVFVRSPSLEVLQFAVVNQAHGFSTEELLCTGEAGRNSKIAVWVRSIPHLGPFKKLLRRVAELTNLNLTGWITSLQQRLAVLHLNLLRLRLVSFCGGQAGCCAVVFSVHLEPVVPFAAPISQCHNPSLEVAPVTISRPAPADTKSASQP